jgi:cytochrome b involved in lipid metabolism
MPVLPAPCPQIQVQTGVPGVAWHQRLACERNLLRRPFNARAAIVRISVTVLKWRTLSFLLHSPSASTKYSMAQRFSTADVASHNKGDNLWIIVDEDVYDLTKFQDEHPGGKKSMILAKLWKNER